MDQPAPGYEATYAAWRRDPEGWWEQAAAALVWERRWDRPFDPGRGAFGQWFPGGRLNTCYNALDRHVEAGHGARLALIWDSPMTGRIERFTYAELRDRTARVAGALRALGVGAGDRVVIYMPMVPEAAITMLACARIGAIHSVVFGGFAAAELAKRIEDATPRVIVSASCGLEPGRVVAYKPLLDAAIGFSAHQPQACLILQREALPAAMVAGRDHDFAAAEAAAAPAAPVACEATDPLYILYTSGTTGKPKGIVRDHGGHAVALLRSMGMIYGIGAGDVFWTASDVGWVVGHSYIVYAPLLAGATSIMYEGKPVGTPDAGAFWRVIAQHRPKVLFTAPTALRAIKQQDPEAREMAKYDFSAFEALYLAGERCDPPTAIWAAEKLHRPVVDHWWQTETGWPITAGFRGLGLFAPKPGSGGRPSPGYDLETLDDEGRVLGRGASGNLALRLPLPPGCAPTLWGDAAGYVRAYLADFPGWYRTGDAGIIDEAGDVSVMGRTDDIINVAGHRLSTGAIEEVLAGHPAVAECAVIGARDALKGQVPVGLAVLKSGANIAAATVEAELVALVRERIGPVASFKSAHVVARLPKTRSGKILRGSIRRLADGEAVVAPATIDDPAILDEIGAVLPPAAKVDPMTLTADQQAEIAAARAQSASTARATVPALEAMLFTAAPVLDHGFVRVIDYMGDDGAVVQAARVSYGRGTKRLSEDAGLIRYLMRHRHTTPFEMCEIKFHVKLPIFVARQWIRHRTANVNEYSARYSILDREFYIPAPDHLAAQSATNRQGRGAVLAGEEAAAVLAMLREDAARSHDHYEFMLNEDAEGKPRDPARQGLARELARIDLTLGTYTQWYWKTDLHNLLHFLALRADAHAQYEIRAYAEAMMPALEAWVPATAAAFRDYRLGAFTFSAAMLGVLRRMLAGESVTPKESGLSRREWEEMMTVLERGA